MKTDYDEAINKLNYEPEVDVKFVVALAGGGYEFFGELGKRGGSSKTLLKGEVIVDQKSFDDFIGGKPDKYVSEVAARQLAVAAYHKARKFIPFTSADVNEVVGIGVTTSLAKAEYETRTSPERAGRLHQIFFAAHATDTTISVSLLLENGRSREDEEKIVSTLILNEMAYWRQTPTSFLGVRDLLKPTEKLERVVRSAKNVCNYPDSEADQAQLVYLMHGLGKTYKINRNKTEPSKATVVFPGSFNPLHTGHKKMKELAEKWLADKGVDGQIYYEMSVRNADKPAMDYIELYNRVKQFKETGDVLYLTNAPKFVDKACLFDKPLFIVGFDTYNRIGDPKYYGSQAERNMVINSFIEAGIGFLVFGREDNGKFKTKKDVDFPTALDQVAIEVDSGDFCENISSSMIRKQLLEKGKDETAKT